MKSYIQKGDENFQNQKYDEALTHYLHIINHINLADISSLEDRYKYLQCIQNIGVTYMAKEDYKTASEYFIKCIDVVNSTELSLSKEYINKLLSKSYYNLALSVINQNNKSKEALLEGFRLLNKASTYGINITAIDSAIKSTLKRLQWLCFFFFLCNNLIKIYSLNFSYII